MTSSDEEDSDLSIIPYDDAVAAISYQAAALRLVLGGDDDIQPASHHALSLAYDALKKRYNVLQKQLRAILSKKFNGKKSNNSNKNGLRFVVESSKTATVSQSAKSVPPSNHAVSTTSNAGGSGANANGLDSSALNVMLNGNNYVATVSPVNSDTVNRPATATRVLVTQQTLEKNKDVFLREFDAMRRRNKELEHENQWLALENGRLQREVEQLVMEGRRGSENRGPQHAGNSCTKDKSDDVADEIERKYASALNHDLGYLLDVVRGLKRAAQEQNAALHAKCELALTRRLVRDKVEDEAQYSSDVFKVQAQCVQCSDNSSEADSLHAEGRKVEEEEEQVACIDITDGRVSVDCGSSRYSHTPPPMTLDGARSAGQINTLDQVRSDGHRSSPLVTPNLARSEGQQHEHDERDHTPLVVLDLARHTSRFESGDGVDEDRVRAEVDAADDEGFRSLASGGPNIPDVSSPAVCLLEDTTCRVANDEEYCTASDVNVARWNRVFTPHADSLALAQFRQQGMSNNKDSAFLNPANSVSSRSTAKVSLARSWSEGHNVERTGNATRDHAAADAADAELQQCNAGVGSSITFHQRNVRRRQSEIAGFTEDMPANGYVANNGGSRAIFPPSNAALVDGDHVAETIVNSGSSVSRARKQVCPVCMSAFLLLSSLDFEQHVNDCIDRKFAMEERASEDEEEAPLTLTSGTSAMDYERNNLLVNNGNGIGSQVDLECEQCGGVFSTRQQLIQHRQTHTQLSASQSVPSTFQTDQSALATLPAANGASSSQALVGERKCPMCFKAFDPMVPQDEVYRHVNFHFVNDDYEYVDVPIVVRQ